MEKYTAYVLNQSSREALLAKFPPKYSKVVAHHITNEFGVPSDTPTPPPAQTKVVGYVDSGDGLEALVVAVNGSVTRPDGKTYHITWSLEDNYKPVDSNALLVKKRYTIIRAIPISTTPEVL